MKGTNLNYIGSLNKAALPDLDEKKNLIDLTKKSLSDERKIVAIDQEYSYASTSWLPIKSHYLVFNILVTIEYILKIQKTIFRLGHSPCIDEFTRKLQTKEMEFSEPLLNQVFDQKILSYVVKAGSNLSGKIAPSQMYKMAIRKIAKYKLDEWKKRNRIDLRKPAHKKLCESYLQDFSVSIFDFLYYMRIRSNYRDFAFINGVSTANTAEYFTVFFNFTVHIVHALERLKRSLVNMRS